ncbi:MAG: GNAT family N-acetyltransferase [Polyangiaceae bacterium]|nr:GNAT family N-acetyltransferase [Polyangiaceae bacterium]
MNALPIRIDSAGASSHHDMLGLLAEHLPETDVAARVAWLYEQNPHGRALTVIAYDAQTNAPLGVSSVFPRRLMAAGRSILGAIGGDAYVRPTARRRGVATAMHQALLERMKSEGVDVMFGPPEPHNLRALERAGSRVITHVRRYVRPALLHDVLRPVSWFAAGRGTRLDPVTQRDRRVDAIFERAVNAFHVVAVRDATFFHWRYGKSPSSAQRAFVVMHEHRAIGVCVLERKDIRVALVDLLAPADDYVRSLHAAVTASGARSVVVQLNEQGPFANELRWAGLLPRERKPFQVLAATSQEPSIFDASRWYYTWGDGDLDRVF